MGQRKEKQARRRCEEKRRDAWVVDYLSVGSGCPKSVGQQQFNLKRQEQNQTGGRYNLPAPCMLSNVLFFQHEAVDNSFKQRR